VTPAILVRLIAAMLVLTAVLSVGLLQFDWFGDAASEEADPIDTLFDVMVVLSSFVFSIVLVMLGYAIWKFRAKPGDESDGEPIHGNTKLEIAWTVIPTIIVLTGAVYSWIVLDDIEAKADDRMPINVTAQQFKWTFEYPDSGVTSNELHVPVDRQLELHLTALDVIHSFWVPEWRIKRDLVPSGLGGDEIDNEVVVTPDTEGSYSVVCTELCGLGHSTMRAFVTVESQAEFDQWIREQQPASGSSAGSSESGGGSGSESGGAGSGEGGSSGGGSSGASG
jgi:cytochrome c oxidase subunit 2